MAFDLGNLFGDESAFRQLMIWGVGQQVLSALMAPGLSALTQEINRVTQTQPLSPEVLADLVVRGFLEQGSAASTAAHSGVSADDFALLVKGTGAAPDTTALVEAFRRRLIPEDSGSPDVPSLVTGIKQGHLDNKWIPMIKGLGDVPISIADAVDAVVEGQISMAEGQAIAYVNGLSAENFTVLYNTRGNPPSPGQLAEMVHRGVIPLRGKGPGVLSFEQGISEGATKDKWIPALEGLMDQLPPARTVTALQRAGIITSDQALEWYRKLGLPQDVAAAYVKDASHGKTAAARHLARGDILTLYTDRLFTKEQALSALGDLGYEAHEAQLEIELADFRVATAHLNQAVTRVRSQFIARHISRETAVGALNSLGVPAEQRDQLLSTWTLERGASLRILTEAQIVDALSLGVLTEQEAEAGLIALGYSPFDAWVLLSIKNKAPLPGRPAGGPSPADRIG